MFFICVLDCYINVDLFVSRHILEASFAITMVMMYPSLLGAPRQVQPLPTHIHVRFLLLCFKET